MKKTLYIFALGTVLGLFYLVLSQQKPAIDSNILEALWFSMIVVITIGIARTIEHAVIDVYFLHSRPHETSDLFRISFKIIVYATIGTLVARYAFDADITRLLATSAVLTVVLGFALQPTLGNLFSGIALELEQPIRIGDYIRRDNLEGRVIAMNWRSITLETSDYRRIVLPNADFTNNPVEIQPANTPTSYKISFHVDCLYPPSEVIAICQQVMSQPMQDLSLDHPGYVNIDSTEPWSGSFKYDAYYFTENMLRYREVGSDIVERLWYALRRKNIPMLHTPGTSIRDYTSQHNAALPAGYKITDATPIEQPDSPTSRCKSALAEQPVLSEIPEAALENLSQDCQFLLFTRDEELVFSRQDIGTLYIVISGSLRVPRSIQNADIDWRKQNDTSHHDYQWPTDFLNDIRQKLTIHIGPIAKTLVRETAMATRDPHALFHSLGALIADPQARSEFLQQAPTEPTETALPGSILGGRVLCIDDTPATWSGYALEQTELLVLPEKNLRKLFMQYPESLNIFARALARIWINISADEIARKLNKFYIEQA